ncbi:MAG TPA: MoxR family ATPase [Verrucomicrobia bacterium]|nr:MoxR family ATPase [Verrucomicrobiota bacterium]
MNDNGLIRNLGVYGYDEVEPLILAALVTGDPLLLIGEAGTGKTYLLNSISEALGLEHRHYNASLISFDDLVGFPCPDTKFTKIKYLETPATAWKAESILIDEISRCKPEHQNRLFSLIHERKLQGMNLPKLHYRWAAMNPCNQDQTGENYEGSIPLDPALADRFSFIVQVPDWSEISDDDRALIADPRGDGRISRDVTGLKKKLTGFRRRFKRLLSKPPSEILRYATAAGTLLGEARYRISPRRVRQLAKNLIAICSQRNGRMNESDFKLVLDWSLPHRAWGVSPKDVVLKAVHRSAWECAFLNGNRMWLNQLHLESRIDKRIAKIIKSCPDSDTGTLAVTQTLSILSGDQCAAFAFALYPVATSGQLEIGREGISELSKIASKVIDVKGEISWQERLNETGTNHPDFNRYSRVLSSCRGKRRERAQQLFHHLLVTNTSCENAKDLEANFHQCITLIGRHLSAANHRDLQSL